MAHHRVQFIGRVANALVVGDCDAIVLAAVFKPLLVGTVRREQIVMSLDDEPCLDEDLGKPFSEIAISEVTPGQAARSYITASSTSGAVMS